MVKKTKTKFITDNVRKMNNYIGVVFGTRVRTHTVGVDAYFVTRIKNRPRSTSNYGIGNTKYNMDYYNKSYCCTENW